MAVASTSLTPSALQLSLVQTSPHDEISELDADSGRDWTNAEDRLLVELVLQKLQLSAHDWVDCARSLGRDPRAVGNRWEMIVGSLVGGARDARLGGGVERRMRLEDSEASYRKRR